MSCIDDDSVDAATMQSTTDPYPADTVSLSTTLQGELRRLRYVVKKLTGWTQWYAHSEAFIFPSDLTLNQGTADGHVLTFRSSDVAHGLTSAGAFAMNTADFGAFQKRTAAEGGVILQAVAETGAGGALDIYAISGAPSALKTTSASGIVTIVTAQHDGANALANVTADGNLLTISGRVAGASTTQFIFDIDGSAHANVEWTTFQDHDDATLLRNVERELARGARIRGTPPSAALQELISLGVVGANGPGGERGLVNITRLQMLQAGAVRQAHDVVDLLLDELMSRRPLTPQERARIPAGIRTRKGITP